MTRSADARPHRGERQQRRKRRRRTLRQLQRARRSSSTLLVLSGGALLLVTACSFGLAAFWCVPQPFLLIASIAVSAVAGLALGGLIRVTRETRALAREDDPRRPAVHS